MIILDTNVVSEIALDQPDENVARWLDRHPSETIWLTSITTMELRFGVELMTDGARKRQLASRVARLLEHAYSGRIAAFDAAAADRAGVIMAERRRRGFVIDVRDTQIAAIAIVRGAALATRNTRHFADLPIEVVNPWTHKA
jgi:predicted nucleic acid-binding protein